MKVLLIRHADQEFPVDERGRKLISFPNSPLSKIGEKQAHSLAEELAKNNLVPDALYVSPYLRAIQTSKILQADLNILNLETVEDLREVDPNSAQGQTLETIDSMDGDAYSHPFSANQETLEHLIERVNSAFKYIVSDANTRNFIKVGIVSHADPLSGLYWALKNKNLPDSYAQMKKNYYPKKGEAFIFTYKNGVIQGETSIMTTDQVHLSPRL